MGDKSGGGKSGGGGGGGTKGGGRESGVKGGRGGGGDDIGGRGSKGGAAGGGGGSKGGQVGGGTEGGAIGGGTKGGGGGGGRSYGGDMSGAPSDTSPPGGTGDTTAAGGVGTKAAPPTTGPGGVGDQTGVTGADLTGGNQGLLDFLQSNAFRSAFDQSQTAGQAVEGASLAAPTGTRGAPAVASTPGGGVGLDPLAAPGTTDVLGLADPTLTGTPGLVGTGATGATSPAASATLADPTSNIGAVTSLTGVQTAAAGASDVEALPQGTSAPGLPANFPGVTDAAGNFITEAPTGLHSGFGLGPTFDQNTATLAALRQNALGGNVDPATMRTLANSIAAEVGGTKDPAQMQSYAESVLNRLIGEQLSGVGPQTLETTLRSHYYPPETLTKLDRPVSASDLTRTENILGTALAGSNVANLATGNQSYGTGPTRYQSAGSQITRDYTVSPGDRVNEQFVQDVGQPTALRTFKEAVNLGVAPRDMTAEAADPFGSLKTGTPSIDTTPAGSPGDTTSNVPGVFSAPGTGLGDVTSPAGPNLDQPENVPGSFDFPETQLEDLKTFNAPMRGVPIEAPTDPWNLEPTVPFRTPITTGPMAGPFQPPGAITPLGGGVDYTTQPPPTSEPSIQPPAWLPMVNPQGEPRPGVGASPWFQTFNNIIPTVPAPAQPNAPAVPQPSAPESPAPEIASPASPAAPSALPAQFTGGTAPTGPAGPQFAFGNQGLAGSGMPSITALLNQNPTLQQAMVRSIVQQNPAVANASPQQQQAIAAFQLNLYNQWAQILLNQGIQDPMHSPQWQQVTKLVNDQTNAQFGLQSQAA